MKSFLLEILICPSCLPHEIGLTCENKTESSKGDIWSGTLVCPVCGALYPICEGVASLLHGPPAVPDAASKYESPSLLSSYLWAHYADLFGDEEANTSYSSWADLIEESAGYFLDAGCAVGRLSFEMARKGRSVIGIDRSVSFIRTARHLMADRGLDFHIRKEGVLQERKRVLLPEGWSTEAVDFIVADAQRMPFPSDLFSSIASLNLVDKIPFPLEHFKEVNRVARKIGTQFLFSDPFSWSREVADEEQWLGGKDSGPFAGNGLNNIRALLTGKKGTLHPAWEIRDQGTVWWSIRNHSNHFERIRSWFIKARR